MPVSLPGSRPGDATGPAFAKFVQCQHRHCKGRWRGSVSLGFGPDGKRIRPRVSGKTKTIVQDRLKKLHEELEAGLRANQGYTVRRAADDWLEDGLSGRAAKTVKKNENVLTPILAAIGARKLRDLTAGDVHQALTLMAQRYSSAAVAMGHNALTRAIRHAEARDRVARNVATLVETPKGQSGRPSNSLTLQQASALLAAEGTRMHAYISLCLATGIRTEEARALRWEHVTFGDPVAQPPVPASAAVWRSVRSHGDTKTEKSRRTLGPCRRWRWTRSGPTRTGKQPNGSPRAGNGTTTTWSSPTERAVPWTRLTSGGNSRPSARRRESARAGHRGNCGTLSSP